MWKSITPTFQSRVQNQPWPTNWQIDCITRAVYEVLYASSGGQIQQWPTSGQLGYFINPAVLGGSQHFRAVERLFACRKLCLC